MLFNRQPSLHKLSIMAHQVCRIIKVANSSHCPTHISHSTCCFLKYQDNLSLLFVFNLRKLYAMPFV